MHRFSLPRPSGSIGSGYDNPNSTDYTVPSCGVEDVDAALFNLFDKQLPMFVSEDTTRRVGNQSRVPVIFAAGEKWALLRKGRALRDNAGTLILPLITIARTGIEQTSNDVTGRGINQQTGLLTFTRRLAQEDRAYQNLINKLYIKNQPSTFLPLAEPSEVPYQARTSRSVGAARSQVAVSDGSLLAPQLNRNIFETIELPAPQFFTAKYEVTIWTQYTQQMNQLLETLMSSFLPQGRCFRLDTQKGYWFVAYVEDSYAQDANFDDMSGQERIIKNKISMHVPAYVLASSAPGVPIAVRRRLSSVDVSFETTIDVPLGYPWVGADDPTLPLVKSDSNLRSDGRDTGVGPLDSSAGSDPALSSYPRGVPGSYVVSGSLLKRAPIRGPHGESTVSVAEFFAQVLQDPLAK